MRQLCLDTYAIIEIVNRNENYNQISEDDFIVPSAILAEVYYVIWRDYSKEKAEEVLDIFRPFNAEVDVDVWLEAIRYKIKYKKEKLSFFDCIGYAYALENDIPFVTGDKAFKGKKNVLHIN